MGKAAVNFYCGNGIYKIAGKSIQIGNGAGNCAVKHRFVACLFTQNRFSHGGA